MIFSSIPFLFFFLPLCLLLYYVVPFKLKNYILLVFSLIFYAWGEPIYIFLMIFSTFIDYFNGRMLAKNNNPKRRKLFLAIAILINLSLLAFFKYSDFLIGAINGLFHTSIPLFGLALPIGISFYTFQTMSYSIDVYRGDVPPEKNYFTYLTYVSMFPQLIAGPIVRYETVTKELYERSINFSNFAQGTVRFLQGLFKKVLIANNIGYLWSLISATAPNEIPVLTAWLGILAFSFQIYFDFSGYSDMAIGMGKMLGFNFLENFNFPYIAKSITDFWRRWHMSLSSWFRDYVYIPLGGSKVKRILNIRNILIVWALTGIWHGAAWNFVFWGMYYGILLLLEKFVLAKFIKRWPNWLKHTYTLFMVLIGWMIFAFDDVGKLGTYASILFGFHGNAFFNTTTLFYLANYGILFFFAILFSMPTKNWIDEKCKKVKNKNGRRLLSVGTVAVYMLLLIVTTSFLVSDTYNPFLYFRF